MIIFRDKADKSMKDKIACKGFVIVTLEKAWMDEYLIIISSQQIRICR